MKLINLQRLIRSFCNAFRGVAKAFEGEMNIYIHCAAAIAVIICGFLFGITRTEWIAAIFAIAMVIAAECFNCAIEQLCDATTKEQNPLIGNAKDIAAGAVLVTAIGAAIVGLIIFVPYIYNLFATIW